MNICNVLQRVFVRVDGGGGGGGMGREMVKVRDRREGGMSYVSLSPSHTHT